MIEKIKNLSPEELMKSVIQRVATGPELSKNISREEAKASMNSILNREVSDVRSAIFLIALRMKRETEDENLGVQDAMNDNTSQISCALDDVINIADPYDGYTRNIPSSLYVLPILAELGFPSFSQGVESVGPKYGCTHHKILKLAGQNVLLSDQEVCDRLENKKIGWGYLDQSIFAPKLYGLKELRSEIIKRPVITTIEVLANPIRAKNTHFVTGYVHKPYPPIYLKLARNAGFDSSIVIRGTEGGVVPSLRQKTNAHFYLNKEANDELLEVEPDKELNIDQKVRAVKIPDEFEKKTKLDKIEIKVDPLEIAKESLKLGMEALSGATGPMRDCIALSASIMLKHVSKHSITDCYKEVNDVLDSGAALKRFKEAL
tara:strand:- start:985 stop:2109 length:1125 start_codon:yes stop_codon:yes gene_type:complete